MLRKRKRDENQKVKEGRKREEVEVRNGGKILQEKVQEKREGDKEEENWRYCKNQKGRDGEKPKGRRDAKKPKRCKRYIREREQGQSGGECKKTREERSRRRLKEEDKRMK